MSRVNAAATEGRHFVDKALSYFLAFDRVEEPPVAAASIYTHTHTHKDTKINRVTVHTHTAHTI